MQSAEFTKGIEEAFDSSSHILKSDREEAVEKLSYIFYRDLLNEYGYEPFSLSNIQFEEIAKDNLYIMLSFLVRIGLLESLGSDSNPVYQIKRVN